MKSQNKTNQAMTWIYKELLNRKIKRWAKNQTSEERTLASVRYVLIKALAFDRLIRQ